MVVIDELTLLATCAERSVAVQTIKSIARRRWLAGDETRHHSWYEPLAEADAIARAVGWVLHDQQVFLNSTSDAGKLPMVLDAAEAASPARPADDDLDRDIAAHGMQPLFDGAELERI
jgi:hypothetical protein